MIENIEWIFFDMGSAPKWQIDNDIVPAKKLGMRTIWIKRGFGRYWNIACEEEKADYEVDHLMEIFDFI